MPWPSYGNAYAGIPAPAGTALATYWHDGTDWVLSPYYAHRDGAWRLISVFPLPADDDVEPPVEPPDTVIALTDLLAVGESLGTANDSVVMGRCLSRAFGRTGAASAHTSTVELTVDFEGETYFCEDPMGFLEFRLRQGRNWKTIVHGNVANPAVKGGIKQVTYDGLNPTRWTGTGTNNPLPGTDGSPATRKYRNRECMQFTHCSYITFHSFSFVGSNTTGPFDSNFTYDVEREAQHLVELSGSQNMRFIDCDISQTFGDVIFTNPWRPPGGGKQDDVYSGMVEALGGTWKKIGRIYITPNQIRAPDGVVALGYYYNPGDGTGPLEFGVNHIPQGNDAPSLSGTQYGLWWHGNAAHPFAGKGCRRQVIDVENMNSFAHCTDITIGADTESTAAIDRANFHLTGVGLFLVSGVNGWGLVHRFKISRLWRTGTGGMAVRIHSSEGHIGGPNTSTIHSVMNGIASSPVPSTIKLTSTAGWPTSGFFQTNVGIFGGGTPIVIKYTGISSLDLTGCTFWDGADGGQPFLTGRSVRQRYNLPERPKYCSDTFTMIDCLFDGTNTSLLSMRRVANMTIERNRANYRIANKSNEIEFTDCPGLDLGPGGEYGNNDFRGV